MHPPAALRIELERARRRDEPFASAWERALPLALAGARERTAWRVALDATKGAWEAAYNLSGHRLDLAPPDSDTVGLRRRAVMVC
jgi:hypothetical protein